MRPRYGDHIEHDRTIEVYFYTSNIHKLIQARLVFARFGYTLRHFRGRQEPYEESYELGTQELLRRAVKQVTLSFGVKSVFFVEDTSIRIDSLSGASDFPGLAAKEWFQSTSFTDLDLQLRRVGVNRSATVNSDIALFLPTLTRPVFFHGETRGKIANTAPTFSESL